MKKILIPFIALVIMATIYLGHLFTSQYQGEDRIFTVAPGEGFSSINYRLKESGIIRNARFFHYYTKFKESLRSFKPGDFEITRGMNAPQVLEKLTKGSPILTKVTFPEGKNLYEMAQILEEKKITTKKEFIKYAFDKKLLKAFGISGPSFEGYLFPDTYKFSKNTPAKTVISTMVNLFNTQVKDLDFSNSSLSRHDVIILASIVEKETGAAFERPTIAGVYLNRLAKPMRLQADPTTIYGIWSRYKGNLRKKDLLQVTPYNTYKINGLPFGPIANPSLAAIKAVLNPKKHNYLYFVSKNDGTHVFTPSYKDHLKAVQQWQLNRKNRKGRSWRDLKQ